MTQFDPDLLKRLDYLALLAQRRGGGPLLAATRSREPRGRQSSLRRDYAPGDDYRQIDWTWCARRDELLTKAFQGYADYPVYILLDCSASMGGGRPSKFHLAQRIAAALGYIALSRLDRLVVTAFADGLVAELPPLRHKTRFPRLLHLLERLSLRQGPTDFARAAAQFAGRCPGPIVILSDLYDRHGFQRGLDILRLGGYEPRLVQIQALQEAEPHLVGDVEMLDVETQRVRRVTITERMARRYQVLLRELQGSMLAYCRKHVIPYVYIADPMPMEQILREVILEPLHIYDVPKIT